MLKPLKLKLLNVYERFDVGYMNLVAGQLAPCKVSVWAAPLAPPNLRREMESLVRTGKHGERDFCETLNVEGSANRGSQGGLETE